MAETGSSAVGLSARRLDEGAGVVGSVPRRFGSPARPQIADQEGLLHGHQPCGQNPSG
jgi:hypothetical protein